MTLRLTILGSTGSIGESALRVAENLGAQVVGLAAGGNVRRLREQVERWRPRRAVLGFGEPPADSSGSGTTWEVGPEAVADLAGDAEADVVVLGISGAAGLPAALAAVRAGKRLALANKEAMVMAGPILQREAERSGAEILPVDSEHSAIFQALQAGRPEEVEWILLTASGGPFRGTPLNALRTATVEDALRHPTWKMGPKITVDSATMMNKALEVVEARWLFDVPADRIRVVVHPQSVVHSLVQFRDGVVMAQLGTPDMQVPIQYALTYPQRLPHPGQRLDFSTPFALDFEPPDRSRFPGLDLGYQAARRGGSLGAVLNAANEAAVEAFLAGRLPFLEIARLVADIIDRHDWIEDPDLSTLLAADRRARGEVEELLSAPKR